MDRTSYDATLCRTSSERGHALVELVEGEDLLVAELAEVDDRGEVAA
jgi:hypothetical protein